MNEVSEYGHEIAIEAFRPTRAGVDATVQLYIDGGQTDLTLAECEEFIKRMRAAMEVVKQHAAR